MERKNERTRSMVRSFSRGLLVLLALAVLTWGELQISALTNGSIPILLLVSMAKAALIVFVFMHISRLWRPS